MAEPSSTIDTGQLVANRYFIEKLLGKGGMGCVYLARDKMLGDEVIALKVLHRDLSDDEKHTKRFLREAQLTRKITHPNVVRTFDVGEWNGNLFLTMEYAEGVSLKDRLTSGVLPWREVARIVAEVSKGLSDIHQQDVVHRDLKPGNVIITKDGAVKITDFGVARPQMSDLTGHNEIVGSAGYMAPEVWIGRKIGAQADIYSLGVMAFEMLVGELPFDAESPAELMCKHLEAKPFPPKDLVPDLPFWLNSLVVKMLAKEPLQRPQSALEIASTIDENLRRPDAAGSSTRMVVDPELLNALKNARLSEQGKSTEPSPSVLGSSSTVSEVRSGRVSSNSIPPPRAYDSVVGSDGRAKGHSGYKSSRVAVLTKQHNVKSGISGNEPAPERSKFAAFLMKSLSLVAVLCIGAVAVSSLHVAGDRLLVSWWPNLSYSTSLFSVGVVALACGVTAAVYAALPVLILGLAGGGVTVAVRAWYRLSVYGVALYGGMVVFYLLQLALSGERLGIAGGEIKLREVVRTALENVLQGGLLSPFGSLHGSSSDDFLSMVPYFLFLMAYLYALARVLRREVFGEGADRAVYVNSCVWWGVSVALVAEYLSRSFLSQMLRWYSMRRHEIPVGGLACGIEEYSIACALINWFVVALVVFVLIPVLAAHHRNSDGY